MSARDRAQPWWLPPADALLAELHVVGERWLEATGYDFHLPPPWGQLDISKEDFVYRELKSRPPGNCPSCGGAGAICRWFNDGGFEVFRCELCAGTGSVPPYHYPSKTKEEWQKLVEADLGLPPLEKP